MPCHTSRLRRIVSEVRVNAETRISKSSPVHSNDGWRGSNKVTWKSSRAAANAIQAPTMPPPTMMMSLESFIKALDLGSDEAAYRASPLHHVRYRDVMVETNRPTTSRRYDPNE